MSKASEEVKSVTGEGTTECGVSVDGCWQKRGYVSFNACITTISTDTGKTVDVEPMPRHCKECEFYNKLDKNSVKHKKHARQTTSIAKLTLWALHQQ